MKYIIDKVLNILQDLTVDIYLRNQFQNLFIK